MRMYENENEIKSLVESFENATISEADWRHAEHLAVALYYLSRNDFPSALSKMRAGIFNLLGAFGVDLSKEMPYHETLTVFWMRAVEDFLLANRDRPLAEICNELTHRFDKDYPLRFYSRELLFGERARSEFVEADLTAPRPKRN